MSTSRYNSLSQLAAVMGGFALTIVLLESEALLKWAQRLDVSEAANIAVQATGELHRRVRPLGLERARRTALASLDRVGWGDDPARMQAAQRAFNNTGSMRELPCAAVVANGSRVVPGSSAALLPHAARISITPETPKRTALERLAPIADGQPRTVALAGDSMMAVGLSDILLRETAADPHVRVVKAFRSGTGLARPDVFDWMQEYPAMLGSERPDAVIVAMGANDGQGMVEDGKVLAFGSDAWVATYQERISAFLSLLTQNGATVVWVGLPPMKSAQYDQKVALINRVTYSVVSNTPHTTWWNPLPYIADQAGAYRDFETTPDGRTTRLRQADGVHLSDEGAMLLSLALIDWLNASPPAPAARVVAAVTPRRTVRKARGKKRRL